MVKGLWTSQLATQLRGNPARSVAKRTAPPPTHHLVLYDYEASPWCRLVREYASILDLTLHMRPCPRQTLWQEGAYSLDSRFRPEAMDLLKMYCGTNDLMFPILVDRLNLLDDSQSPIVLQQSYNILNHLWRNYGESVVPSAKLQQRRRDQVVNASTVPFPLRFLSLAAPSYLRPWPHCGLFRIPNRYHHSNNHHVSTRITLSQSEGCPGSRLVRELLCSMEIPYRSIPVAHGSYNQMPSNLSTPVLAIECGHSNGNAINPTDGNESAHSNHSLLVQGAKDCLNHLQGKYGVFGSTMTSLVSPWLYHIPPMANKGRHGGNLAIGAYTAFIQGSCAFVPPCVLE